MGEGGLRGGGGGGGGDTPFGDGIGWAEGSINLGQLAD